MNAISKGYLTLEQLAQTVGKESGVPIPSRHIPYAVLNLLAHAGEWTSHIIGTQPTISVNAVKALNRRHEVTAAKAVRELGVTFRTFEETIRDTINWFLANGYVHAAVQLRPTTA